MTATEISRLLAGRVTDLCAYLLPNGEDMGGEWCVGSTSGEPGGSLKIPLHGPKLGMFRDFAGADTDKGDLLGLWKAVKGVDVTVACQQALEWLNIPQEQRNGYRVTRKQSQPKPVDAHWTELQAKFRKGTVQELQALADQRKLGGTAGLEIATNIGQLFFTDVYDHGERHPAWILTDATRLNGQARKVDGTEWKFDGKRKPAKSKTVWSPEAGWPIGIKQATSDDIVLVEGNPDFLAAHQLIWNLGREANAVALFGASTVICEEALPFFAKKRVFIMAHSEESGAGLKAAQRWEKQLKASGASTIIHTFAQDGVKDLNDLLSLYVRTEDESLVQGLWVGTTEVEDWDSGPNPEPVPDPKESKSDRILRILKESRYTPGVLLPKPVPIFTAAGTTICTPGNLTALYSQAKAGKTATIGAMLAATMEPPGAVNDTLGFKGSNTDGLAVLHIDTEQSKYDWQQMIVTACKRAGTDQPPSWLCSHILTGLTAPECRMALDAALEQYSKDHKGIYAVFIDGIGDLVTDVNEPKECNELVAHLHGLAIKHNCAIVLILHLNPASDVKGRGHLGSQLERKSESNLMLEKTEDGTTRFYATKQRGKTITKAKALCFRWSDEAQMHVSVASTEQITKAGRPKKYEFTTFQKVFPRESSKAETRQILYNKATDMSDIKDTAFRALLADGVQSGELIQTETPRGYVYHLNVPGGR